MEKPTSIKFVVHNDHERARAESWHSKEPGTIKWLDELRTGDVFYDIGANYGVYTLYAAHLVGPEGLVYAFEPHIPTAAALIENVRYNKFEDRVRLISVPLHLRNDWLLFNYQYALSSTSGHQLGHTNREYDGTFQPEFLEWKYSSRLDDIYLRPAHMIKIDVDGNEPSVLQGMIKTLQDPVMRSVQVEVNPRNVPAITNILDDAGYELGDTHYTAMGQSVIDQGVPKDKVTYNAIFRRKRNGQDHCDGSQGSSPQG